MTYVFRENGTYVLDETSAYTHGDGNEVQFKVINDVHKKEIRIFSPKLIPMERNENQSWQDPVEDVNQYESSHTSYEYEDLITLKYKRIFFEPGHYSVLVELSDNVYLYIGESLMMFKSATIHFFSPADPFYATTEKKVLVFSSYGIHSFSIRAIGNESIEAFLAYGIPEGLAITDVYFCALNPDIRKIDAAECYAKLKDEKTGGRRTRRSRYRKRNTRKRRNIV
jgi:hypothetical protein